MTLVNFETVDAFWYIQRILLGPTVRLSKWKFYLIRLLSISSELPNARARTPIHPQREKMVGISSEKQRSPDQMNRVEVGQYGSPSRASLSTVNETSPDCSGLILSDPSSSVHG